MPEYYIGTSGWHYDHWWGRFYPTGLSKARWLEYYAQHFSTVELNNSFYRLPSEKAFVAWRESSPRDFVYAVKVSHLITHIRRLRNIEQPLKNFIDRARLLEGKLGPLLYQLPPQMPRNEAVLEDFLTLLPSELKHAFEFRHPSWLDDKLFAILQRYNAGLCIYDLPDFTTPVVASADFAYIRFHGSVGLYSSCYTDREMEEWADRITYLVHGLKAVYIYFNNDAQGYAIRNALTLANKLQARSPRG